MMPETTELKPTRLVPRYARVDVIGGATMIFIAALVWFGAIGLDIGTIINFGSGAMPRGLSALLFVAGIVLLIQGLTQGAHEAETLEFAARPTAIVTLAVVLFGLFVRGGQFGFISTPQLGLAVVGPITVFIAGCASPEARVGQLLVLAFGLTAATLVLFPDLLRVPIPVFPGFVQSAIPPAFGADAALRVLYCAYGLIAATLYLAFFRMRGRRHD